ncbi:MAG: leucine-rich repeat domain-containing protein [Clostridia bacterium]|nr:leucine-rich repeat domain-containing protein [Clostridia bacterium]
MPITLYRVTIPDSVTLICNQAFYGCSNLKSVTFTNTTGWAVFTSLTAASGTYFNLTNAEDNAAKLTGTYCDYFWIRSNTLM